MVVVAAKAVPIFWQEALPDNCLSETFSVTHSVGVCFYNKYIPVGETASIKNKWEEGSGVYGKVTTEEQKWPLCVGYWEKK